MAAEEIRFQSTLPRRERRAINHELLRLTYFNPRSREGSDKFGVALKNDITDFNPRSREGSDECHVDNIPATDKISIHAPAKGATHFFNMG